MNRCIRALVPTLAMVCAVAGCAIGHDPPITPPVISSTEPAPPPTPPAKLAVAVNIWAFTWLVKRIGGDLVDQPLLFEAETHQPLNADDLELLKSTDTQAVVYMGNLNPDAMKVLADRATRDPERFLDVARVGGLKPRPAPPELPDEKLPDGTDPHVWLDPGDRMTQIAAAVLRALTVAVAQHPELGKYRGQYSKAMTQRRDEVVGELAALRNQMERTLAGCKGRTVVPEHPAYAYLTEAFGLSQLALTRIGAQTRRSPEVEDAQARRLDALWSKGDPKVLFLEHSKGFGEELRDDDERLYFHTLANKYNVDLSYLSSLEKAPERPKDRDHDLSYVEAMQGNAEHIKSGLRC